MQSGALDTDGLPAEDSSGCRLQMNERRKMASMRALFMYTAWVFGLTTCSGISEAQNGAPSKPPMVLSGFGSFYVDGHMIKVGDKAEISGQMYTEFMIPAKRTHPYPIIMVHGGLRTGTNFTGTPDGREGWAQFFVRNGYAVYVVDQPGRGRSAWNETYGPAEMANATGVLKRYVDEEKYQLWPQARLHTQWPGGTTMDDPAVMQLSASQAYEIKDFHTQQVLNRESLIALVDKIGPSIILAHSQAGAFLWPVADARPDKIKAILGIEPNGPPVHAVDLVGAPEWFKYDPKISLAFGISDVPLTYSPPVRTASDLSFVQQAKADSPDLVRCYAQVEPARQLPNLEKMPILILTTEASYHAPYDHCTVRYLQQAGVRPTFIRLADIGIHGNSHVMMLEKNSDQIAGVILQWLEEKLGGAEQTSRQDK